VNFYKCIGYGVGTGTVTMGTAVPPAKNILSSTLNEQGTKIFEFKICSLLYFL